MHFWIQKLHRNHVWGRWICFWCSDVAKIVIYWFGLHRGRVTSTWQKLRSTSQNYLPYLIWSQFVDWGPFYSTACPKNRTLLSPFSLSLSLDTTFVKSTWKCATKTDNVCFNIHLKVKVEAKEVQLLRHKRKFKNIQLKFWILMTGWKLWNSFRQLTEITINTHTHQTFQICWRCLESKQTFLMIEDVLTLLYRTYNNKSQELFYCVLPCSLLIKLW